MSYSCGKGKVHRKKKKKNRGKMFLHHAILSFSLLLLFMNFLYEDLPVCFLPSLDIVGNPSGDSLKHTISYNPKYSSIKNTFPVFSDYQNIIGSLCK